MRSLVRLTVFSSLLVLLCIIYSLRLMSLYEATTVFRHDDVDKFAYVFYATSDLYACSALVNVHRLQRLFQTRHPIFLLVSGGVSTRYRDRFGDYNVSVIEHEPPPLPIESTPYYRDVLLKLVSFRLHHWAPQVQRIVVLDADQLILRPLDGLFRVLDKVHDSNSEIVAPHAYWLHDRPIATSAMMMVNLSETLWERMNGSLAHIAPDRYDMDLINAEFDVVLLPGHFLTLNSHWETNTLPGWSRFNPDHTEWPPRGKRALVHKNDRDLFMVGPAATGDVDVEDPSPTTANTTGFNDKQVELDSAFDSAFDPLTHIFEEDVYVLHFTALGKPWSFNVRTVHLLRPQAHPLFAQQFLVWRTAAKHVCPSLRVGEKGAREIVGKKYEPVCVGGAVAAGGAGGDGTGATDTSSAEMTAGALSDRFLDET
jgi:hypothetical protein